MAEKEKGVAKSSLIKMPWRDLKRAVPKQMTANFNELKQQCKEEWAKSPPQQCERLPYRKQLLQVITAKDGSTGN